MHPSDQDREGQELLDELAQLQADNNLSPEEPPLLIDQAVRNMARRELHTTPVKKGRGLRWIAGLSTASVALIALGISLVQAPKSSLPPLKPILESMSTKQSGSRANREDEPGRLEPRSQSDLSSTAAQTRKADRPSAATAKAMEMPAESAALEESISSDSINASEANFADSVQRLKKEMPKDIPDANAWLNLIRQLKDQGQDSEATKQLQTFQSTYPDFVLPDWAAELVSNTE